VCLETEHPVIVQTRQELILRDLDVLEALAERGLVNVMISMQTPIEGIRNKIELGTATVSERYRTMRMLTTKGIPVGLLLSPIMPELTDDADILEETVRRAGDAGAKWVVAQVLDLRGSAGVKVRLFIESFIPTLASRYEELYSHTEKGKTAEQSYVHRMTEQVVPNLATKYGLDDFSRMLTSGRDPLACLIRK
jgi:DNA repair photolyase